MNSAPVSSILQPSELSLCYLITDCGGQSSFRTPARSSNHPYSNLDQPQLYLSSVSVTVGCISNLLFIIVLALSSVIFLGCIGVLCCCFSLSNKPNINSLISEYYLSTVCGFLSDPTTAEWSDLINFQYIMCVVWLQYYRTRSLHSSTIISVQ